MAPIISLKLNYSTGIAQLYKFKLLCKLPSICIQYDNVVIRIAFWLFREDAYTITLSMYISTISIINCLAMKQHKQQPLYFYAPGEQNLQKTLGKKQPINPYKLLTPSSTPHKQTQTESTTKGKFYYDHLIPDEQVVKSKGIKKNEKRKNYKTKMCPHGRDCRHKFSCTFAHNENELRRPFLKRTKPCKMYQLGKCQLGASCREYHGNIDLMKKNYKYKSQYCKQFVASGKCQKGRVCIYIHEMPPEQNQEAQHEADSQGSVQKKEQEVVQPCTPLKQQPAKDDILKQPANESLEQPANEPALIQPATNPTLKQSANRSSSKQPKQIVQVIEQKLGSQQIVQGGLTLNFML